LVWILRAGLLALLAAALAFWLVHSI